MTKCLRCERESSGVLIQLCDSCFDEWEKEIKRNPMKGDIGPVDRNLVYKAAGGNVPDNITTARVSLKEDCVFIKYGEQKKQDTDSE